MSGWIGSAVQAPPGLAGRGLPVLAGWGYNTDEQKAAAVAAGYVVLREPAELAGVLDSAVARRQLVLRRAAAEGKAGSL